MKFSLSICYFMDHALVLYLKKFFFAYPMVTKAFFLILFFSDEETKAQKVKEPKFAQLERDQPRLAPDSPSPELPVTCLSVCVVFCLFVCLFLLWSWQWFTRCIHIGEESLGSPLLGRLSRDRLKRLWSSHWLAFWWSLRSIIRVFSLQAKFQGWDSCPQIWVDVLLWLSLPDGMNFMGCHE